MAKTTSTTSPLEMDYAGIVEWAQTYLQSERDKFHVLDQPSPVLLTTAYAEDVVSGNMVASIEVKQACKRHLKDIKRSEKDPNYPWEFDEHLAWRPIKFIEKKCHPTKGDFKHLVMQPWQHFIVGSMFGWVDKKTKKRRFREALIFVGRKNGKTELESGLADYMAGFDGENGPNVYFLANSQQQSRILYEGSRSMITKSPWLAERFIPNRSEIRYPKTGGKITAMSAEKSNKDGENVHFAVFDEIHEYQDYGLINVMKNSRGARTQPLIVYITTAGYVLDGPLIDMVDQATDTLKNYDADINNRTFYYIARLDDEKEVDDPTKWVKANPNIGLMQLADMINDFKNDRRVPANYADWLTKRFNIFAETDEMSFITPEILDKNRGHFEIEDLRDLDCVGGYDLSDTEDFTSACLEFPLNDGGVFILEHSWIPEKRFERDKNPERIRKWEKQGEITIVPGDYVDYSYVLEWFQEQANKYNIIQINYDPAKALRLNKELEEAGFTTEVVRQGFYTLGGPMQNFKELLLDGKVVFNEQSMFKWYLNNVQLRQDRNDNWLPTKTSKSRKIDGFAAALDAHVSVIDMLVEPESSGPTSMFISFR
ncbi:terminase large subunit [Limosilactobacillus fermentum]|uniref:terminase large subunit n=1 Tax=Limosilactobacillus fermentum TaxID=1613 RepID=UPI0021A44ABE|nr:terminase large subunit [Limosilactobacillus fermentum]MCT3427751.1 terminase large subunit [Limosilactobacillus fermentum]